MQRKRKRKQKSSSRSRNSSQNQIVEYSSQDQIIKIPSILYKYYKRRYSLFSKYDYGIKLDDVGWYSVTPEPIASVHASHSPNHSLVIDCFAGVAGNSIQFAKRKCHVIAIEVDANRVELGVNNVNVYGVESYVDFVIGDFLSLAPSFKADVAFLAPPWGGPSYRNVENYTLDMLKPKNGCTIFQAARNITPNIIMFLPRNMDQNQVFELSWLFSPPIDLKIEENYVQAYCKGITAYFGDTASKSYEEEEEW